MPDVASGFDFSSVGGVASKTGKPAVWTKVRVEGQTIASGMLEPAEARQIALQLLYAADMAIADAALFEFLQADPDLAAHALAEQRGLREKYVDPLLGPRSVE